jgi:hypothetical protein
VADALTAYAAGSDLARLVSRELMPDPPPGETPAAETGSFGPVTAAPVRAEDEPAPASTLVSRPPRRRWGVAGAVLAVAGLSAALLLWLRHNSDGSPRDAGQEPAVGVWYNLLDRPPEPLLWPPGEVPPGFEAKRQRLYVNCEGQGLLRLGTAPPHTAYKVQIGFRQPQWTGGIGIFAGYAEETQRRGTVSFQQIMLTPPAIPTGRYSLSRSTGVLLPSAPLRPVLSGLYTEEVGKLGPREYVLEIEVEKNGFLSDVRWDGKKMNVLIRSGPPEAPTPPLSAGAFGVAVNRGSAVVTTARWIIQSQE